MEKKLPLTPRWRATMNDPPWLTLTCRLLKLAAISAFPAARVRISSQLGLLK